MIYADELGEDAVLTFTRQPPDGWGGHAATSTPRSSRTGCIVGLRARIRVRVERVRRDGRELLLGAGFEARHIRTERFGPTS